MDGGSIGPRIHRPMLPEWRESVQGTAAPTHDPVVQAAPGSTLMASTSAYARAGVVAFLFGRGANGATCACDAAKDGVT
jgi:hypothetical protein